MLREASVADLHIVKNDELSVQEALQYEACIISPGPDLPQHSGILLPYLQACTSQKILGVCLGHQAIAMAAGIALDQLEVPRHGYASQLIHTNEALFKGISPSTTIGFYHSWYVPQPPDNTMLEVLATAVDGLVAAIKHKSKPQYGVQFHIESFMTQEGAGILENWLRL
jgi:anthranilate synthase/aminodeoxychorismate synthase-like glutamine amidotransferase